MGNFDDFNCCKFGSITIAWYLIENPCIRIGKILSEKVSIKQIDLKVQKNNKIYNCFKNIFAE